MPISLTRLAHMDWRELRWRSAAAGRVALDRLSGAVRPPRWNREALMALLGDGPDLAGVRAALRSRQWLSAHRELAAFVSDVPGAFPIAPGLRQSTTRRIRSTFPLAAESATARAAALLQRRYDLLGYRDLSFGDPVDWHFDPVHGCRTPRLFWSRVPFLNADMGDHKIIWELNRHQHWLVLGRAFWLTGDHAYRRAVVRELTEWMAANPPLTGANWSSMLELAFRSISWLWALNFFAEGAERDDTPWTVDLLLALDRQLLHIEHNFSCYFSPNTHLIGEALALYVGGLAAPMLKRSARRAALGRRILIEEIGRQIHADGGHCERSTHYHRYTLDFYLLALVVARGASDPAAAAFEAAVITLATAARALADDAGILPHIGDDDGGAAFRIAGRPLDDISDSLEIAAALTGRPDFRTVSPTEEASWLLARPECAEALDLIRRQPLQRGPRSVALGDTGYYISRSRTGDHIVMDAGAHGYLNGGHAHADSLSLTLSVNGTPLLIDTGTHCYTVNPTSRDRMRSTALHNTVVVDERQASEPAGAFRWDRVANGHVNRWRSNRCFDYLDAGHDGYAPIEHRRRVFALHGDVIVVADVVGGGDMHTADAHWHLAPDWRVTGTARKAVATCGNQWAEIIVPGGGIEQFSADADTGLGWHAPVYGCLEPSTTLRVRRAGHTPIWVVTVIGLRADASIERADIVPVWSAAGSLEHSLAVRLTRPNTVDTLVIAEGRDPSRPAAWRAADVESDAAMLWVRVSRDLSRRAGADVAIVDGSRARHLGAPAFAIDLRSRVPDAFLDHDELRTFDFGRPDVRDCRIR
ncbi:MAG TPA: alginate lyase family protein [Vicinamibacterales bacterium]|nr:alginate lyase family protein [Vicinamibacterales bacterium]